MTHIRHPIIVIHFIKQYTNVNKRRKCFNNRNKLEVIEHVEQSSNAINSLYGLQLFLLKAQKPAINHNVAFRESYIK